MQARLKWLLVGAALVGMWSAWIAFSPAPQPKVEVTAAAMPRAQRPTAAASAGAAWSVPELASTRARRDTAGRPDAFATRHWEPPPPPPPPPVVAPPAPPPPPPPLPTLPYKFVGLLDDAKGSAKPRVFLALGDKLLVASPGDVLEGGFRLESIGPRELVFIYLQQNLTLKLSVAGGDS